MCRLSFVIAVAAILAGGCARPEPHPWLRTPPANVRDRNTWVLVPHVSLGHGHPGIGEPGAAAAQLGELQALELSDEVWTALADDAPPARFADSIQAPPRDPAGARPFLARGLAFGGRPSWARAWYSPSANVLWIHHGTWVPEFWFPGSSRQRIERVPVAVLLGRVPDAVYVTCIMGGDRVMVAPRLPRNVPW